MSLHLNIGAGIVPLPDHIDIDRKSGGEAFPLHIGHREGLEKDLQGVASFVRHDNGQAHWELLDGVVDSIYASHVLEHFSHRQTLDVLTEWVRVLKPGGTLKIAVPDFDYIVNRYVNGSGNLPLEGFLFGGHVDEDDRHGAMFNEQKLITLMHAAGLGDVQKWTSEVEDCARLPVSLNLMGAKGARKLPSLKGKVAACFSVPRLGFMDNQFSAMRAFVALEIPALRKSGAFWGQCMEGCMELNIDTAPYILTCDYDTVFEAADIVALYRLLEKHPEADAVCAVQSGRERATPLMTVIGPDGKNRSMLTPEEVAGDLLELRTGHFGLTLLRSASIKKMSKPWFNHVPDKDGSWGDGRTDDDIFFWLKFRETGCRLFQANRVVVGHAQLMVSYPNQHMETQHIYSSTLESEGKPDWVWR